jgi:hypothetical protein
VPCKKVSKHLIQNFFRQKKSLKKENPEMNNITDNMIKMVELANEVAYANTRLNRESRNKEMRTDMEKMQRIMQQSLDALNILEYNTRIENNS